jgi:hypothetical protein
MIVDAKVVDGKVVDGKVFVEVPSSSSSGKYQKNASRLE